MKRAFAIAPCTAALMAAVGLGLSAAPSHAADVGSAVPLSRELRALDGSSTSLAAMKGQVVVLNFWASWCAPCRKELRVLETWKPGLAQEGAALVAVSVDRDLRKAEKFVKETGLDLPFYHDGPEGLAKSLDLPALPCTVVLDRDGRVAHVAEGGDQKTLEELRRLVETMSAAPKQKTVSAEVGG